MSVNAEKIIIRKYKKEDKESVRKICCDTAFMGQPMEIFFSDREVLADILTSYYTDYEPESLFVADYEGRIVGYLMGCKDTAKKEKVFLRKIFPKILFNFLRKGIIFNKKNSLFFLNALKSFIKGESAEPKIPKIYQAHLHINVDSNFRRFGLGAKLMNIFFDYLKDNNIFGVHLSTFS